MHCHPPLPGLLDNAFPGLNHDQTNHETNGILVHGNSSVIQLLLYYVITLIQNWNREECRCRSRRRICLTEKIISKNQKTIILFKQTKQSITAMFKEKCHKMIIDWKCHIRMRKFVKGPNITAGKLLEILRKSLKKWYKIWWKFTVRSKEILWW